MQVMYEYEQDISPEEQRTRSPDADTWEDTDTPDVLLAEETETTPFRTEDTPDTDILVARYFAEVRQHALLSVAEERALWAQIEHAKGRSRRALYTSPVALATLVQVWQQVERGALSLQQVMRDAEKASNHEAALRARLTEALSTLKALETTLHTLRTQGRATPSTGPARRVLRQECATRWHQWLAIWEALDLQPEVHETLQRALEEAWQTPPVPRAVHVAYRAWSHAHRALIRAKARMLLANLRLVIHLAKRYRHDSIPFLDLIQEGNAGLMRALDKFEPQRGVKFVTYAYWWIRQAIRRAIVEQHGTVRVPEHVVERQHKLRATEAKLAGSHGRSPSTQELSAALGWSVDTVDDLHRAGQPIMRLQRPSPEGDGTLLDTVADDQTPAPEQSVAMTQFHQRLALCLARLPAREALILRLRYGLEGEEPQSLQEIGDYLGLSRERIRQLENQALETLRQPKQRALLADFADQAYHE